MMYVIVRVYDTAGRLEPDLKSLFSNVGCQSAVTLVLCIVHLATVHVRTRRADESLAIMVQTHSNRLCSDPKNTIYALLNVSLPIALEINHERPVDELYTTATEAMINFEENLKIISTSVGSMRQKTSLAYRISVCRLEFRILKVYCNQWRSTRIPMNTTGNASVLGGNLRPSRDVLSTGDSRNLAVDGGFYGEIEDADSTVRAGSHALVYSVAVAIGTLRPEVLVSILPRSVISPEKLTTDGEVLRFLAMDVYRNPRTGFDERMENDAETRRSFLSDSGVKDPSRKLLYCLEASLREESICTTTTRHMASRLWKFQTR
ncbi:hypothetical protein N7G274_005767 [Stereocaulon virgatum]|uniref:Uncharacterized protein n=1 Tax=Stereocaulon virgatum TaxID=373712 RepID=A0ABR4A8F8_9LECA